jgi:hypothetical protein
MQCDVVSGAGLRLLLREDAHPTAKLSTTNPKLI